MTLFPERPEWLTESHEGNLAQCQAVWVELNPAHCHIRKALTTGWVSQHRPGGGATAMERLEWLTEIARQVTEPMEGREEGHTPGLCWLRQSASKNLGLEQLRRHCCVRITYLHQTQGPLLL